MNCFGLRSNITSSLGKPDRTAAQPRDTSSDTISASEPSGSAATGMPFPYTLGEGAWKNLGQPSLGLKGGGMTKACNKEAETELDDLALPVAPAAPVPFPAALPAANPTLLQQIANLPVGAKVACASLGLGAVGGFVALGVGVNAIIHSPSAHPNPAPAEPPVDPMFHVLYNATEAAVARCYGSSTAIDPDHHFDVMPSYTGEIYNQGVWPLTQAGVANVTQAIQQLSCPALDADDSIYRRLGTILRAFVQQLGELAPHLPAPAPHTGASARVAADVVGTMALTVALHTLGLF